MLCECTYLLELKPFTYSTLPGAYGINIPDSELMTNDEIYYVKEHIQHCYSTMFGCEERENWRVVLRLVIVSINF